MSWPASAPADAFGSWSPASAPPDADGAAAPGNAPPNWPASGPPANLPQPAGPSWPPAGVQPGQAAPPNWPTSGAPGFAPGGAPPNWPVSGAQGGGDLAAENWPGAGPGLGQTPLPWVASAPVQQGQAGQPGPAPWGPGELPVEAPQRGRPIWIFPAIVAVVLLLAGGTVAFVLRDRWLPGGGVASPTAGPTGEPTSTGNPVQPTDTGNAQPTPVTPTAVPPTSAAPTLPTSVGAVRLDPSLDLTRGPAVAAIFDRYFAAVNARNTSAALAVMDPNGSINQGDANAVKRFGDGISTSTDDDILLLGLGSDPTGKGLLQAHVTFRSQQQAGKGPKGRESETCTRWDVTYSITQPGGGDYRIWGSTGAGSRPC